jgi:hypothetical protein
MLIIAFNATNIAFLLNNLKTLNPRLDVLVDVSGEAYYLEIKINLRL